MKAQVKAQVKVKRRRPPGKGTKVRPRLAPREDDEPVKKEKEVQYE